MPMAIPAVLAALPSLTAAAGTAGTAAGVIGPATAAALAPTGAVGLGAGAAGLAGSALGASGVFTPAEKALGLTPSPSVATDAAPQAPNLPGSTPGIGLSTTLAGLTQPPTPGGGSQTGQNAVAQALSGSSQDPYGGGFN